MRQHAANNLPTVNYFMEEQNTIHVCVSPNCVWNVTAGPEDPTRMSKTGSDCSSIGENFNNSTKLMEESTFMLLKAKALLTVRVKLTSEAKCVVNQEVSCKILASSACNVLSALWRVYRSSIQTTTLILYQCTNHTYYLAVLLCSIQHMQIGWHGSNISNVSAWYWTYSKIPCVIYGIIILSN